MEPFFGTSPVLNISSGRILTKAFSSNAPKELNAWFANIFLSAKNKIRGNRLPSP